MSTDIRKYIKKNFKKADVDEIRDSIVDSIKEKEEVTLPGLGVFFEVLWDNSDDTKRNDIVNILQSNISK